jgi:hypothetical protein
VKVEWNTPDIQCYGTCTEWEHWVECKFWCGLSDAGSKGKIEHHNTKYTVVKTAEWKIPEGITCHKYKKLMVGLYAPSDWQVSSDCHVDDVYKSVSVCWVCDVYLCVEL